MLQITALQTYRQFVLYRTQPSTTRPGKTDKIPCDITGQPCNAHAPANWMDAEAAEAAAQALGLGIGFVLTDADPFFCLDIDGCLEGAGWSAKAQHLLQQFPGAGVEISNGGHGLHIWGKYTGAAPAHGCRNAAYSAELYSRARFIALGHPGAIGDASADCTAALAAVIAEFFPPAKATTSTTPQPPHGVGDPAEDDALIARMLAAPQSAQAAFGGKASFKQLWEADAEALARAFPDSGGSGRAYDASSADAALAQHLAYWTAKDAAQMERLMRMSDLAREKYDRPDYLQRTIGKACDRQDGVYRPPATATGLADSEPDATGDIRNGQAFAQRFRDKLLFVYETGDVLKFDDAAGWLHAPPGEADRSGKRVVAVMRGQAAEQWKANPDDPKTKRFMKHVEQSSAAQKIAAMVAMAKSEPGMTVRLSDLDADVLLLGVANGVLDLRSGALMSPSPSMMVTKRCPVPFDPGATSPVLDAFIGRITRNDPALAKFLQRLAGYILTGAVSEQCFVFLYGVGRNGKSTFSELLLWLLGEYGIVLPTATLMMAKRDPGAASPDLMLLKGRRLALASEPEENARFAEATIKGMTGGDTMTARNPYGTFATWLPTHKLMIVGNHKPVIAGGDYGIWRRVRLVPFNEKISDDECDGDLWAKLRAEGAGVLNWALAGLRDWQRGGLNPPVSVVAAVAAYQTDMDVLGEWLDDHTLPTAGSQTPTADLYRAYEKWANESGWKNPMTRNAFGRRLSERGISIIKAGNGNKCATGIGLNADGQRAANCFAG